MKWIWEQWEKHSNHDDRCGIGFLHTHSDDPFIQACRIHDVEYVRAREGRQPHTRLKVDRDFLKRMLEIADSNNKTSRRLGLRARAYTYYAVVRVVGGAVWHGP